MKLIPDWHKKIHKLWTSRLAILGTFIGVAGEALPDMQDFLPKQWYIGLFLLILVMRFVAQSENE